MKAELIKAIADQLNIASNDDKESICRIIYCAAGRLALASLWDQNENGAAISVQHFKNRLSQAFSAFEDFYPKSKALFPREKTDLIDEIYDIYLRNGFFYHFSHHISPAVLSSTKYGNVTLFRGVPADANLCMSGLGLYSMTETDCTSSIAEMFHLQEQPFDAYLEEIIQAGHWEPIEWPENTEFLKLDPKFTSGYWLQSPGEDGRISIARYGKPNKVYALYRYSDNCYYHMPIPEWRLQDMFSSSPDFREYRRIATALLMRYGTLPNIQAAESDGLIEIRLGYRLPPAEEEFFMLFSWPLHYDFSEQTSQVFRRQMSKAVYSLFRHVLTEMGYQFTEELL